MKYTYQSKYTSGYVFGTTGKQPASIQSTWSTVIISLDPRMRIISLYRPDKKCYPYLKERISQPVVWWETMTGKYKSFLNL